MRTLAEIDAAIHQLEAWVPTMLAETDEFSQLEAFAERADLITENLPPEHYDHAWSRIQCILRDKGLIPGDEEPCSD